MAKKNSEGLAIAALLINILILPGLGSIIGKRTKEGVYQLVIFAIGVVLTFILIGIPLVIGAWIWALVTGIQMVKEAQ